MTVDLALGVGMAFARNIRLALGIAPAFAASMLSRLCCLQLRFCDFLVETARLRVGSRVFQFGFDVDEAGSRGEPPCRTRWGVRCGNKAVPAPQIALGRDQPLAALQLCCEERALFAADHADLAQATLQFNWRFDVIGERL